MAANIDANYAPTQARRLEGLAAKLDSLLRQPEAAGRLRTHPGEGEWSVMQILGHLAESVPYWLDNCRKLIDTPSQPPVMGRKPDAPERLAGVELGASGEMDQLVLRVEAEILAAAQAIRGLSPADLGKTGLHMRDGEVTVAQVIQRYIVTHVEEHLTQIQAALRE